ncbi:MAG: MFS transporter [Bacteroidia bacterium]|jgi:MFS family permease
MQTENKSTLLVIIAALGYFVDIYDLVLFNVVKKESLEFIGLTGEALKKYDISLFNWQMTGMLMGGLLWGILGDKAGRIQVLFGSIILYSLANLANAFVTNTDTYAICRILAGIGLAGELGAGITLVVESMEKSKRGWGTMIIVTFGALGGVAARLVGGNGAELAAFFHLDIAAWQMAYIVGGVMGIMLLVLRVGAFESGMFHTMINSKVSRGNFFMLFSTRKRTLTYLASVVIGLPIWFVIGVLINQSHTLAAYIGVEGEVHVADSVMWSYIGLSVGDLISGALSQWLKSRRKVIFIYLMILALTVLFYVFNHHVSLDWFHFMCMMLGASTGFWALFVTVASEQFGTNLRSTVTNTAPNFVRGATVPITKSFEGLIPLLGVGMAAISVGGVCILLSFLATWYIKESFSKDLDYFELD